MPATGGVNEKLPIPTVVDAVIVLGAWAVVVVAVSVSADALKLAPNPGFGVPTPPAPRLVDAFTCANPPDGNVER